MSAPVIRGIMSAPVIRGIMSAPVIRGIMSASVIRGIMSAPVIRGIMSAPVIRGIMSAPVIRGIMMENTCVLVKCSSPSLLPDTSYACACLSTSLVGQYYIWNQSQSLNGFGKTFLIVIKKWTFK